MTAHMNKLVMAMAMFAIVSVALLGATSAVDAVGEDEPVADETVTITYQMVGNVAVEKTEDKGLVILDTPEALNMTVPDGKEYVGWTVNGTDTIVSFDDLQEDVTVTAVLKDVIYTINFVDSDGTLLDTQTGILGADVKVPADPSKEGYIFKGWNNGTETLTNIPKVAGNVTYTAVYQKDVNIMFVSGSEIVGEMKLSALTVPAAPALDGQKFVGWYVFGDESKTIVDPAKYAYGDNDVRFVAEYKAVEVVDPGEPDEPIEPVEPETPAETDNTGIYACLVIIAIAVIVGGIIFVWTLKKDKKN